MKSLSIIRHAKSDWSAGVDDILRPLNERGKSATKLIGNYLQQKSILPDLIISSPATRAQDTAKAIARAIHYDVQKIQTEPCVYFGTSTNIVDKIKTLPNTMNDVFIFGHEPILSSLIYQFTKNTLEKFPTCAVYRISFDMNDWSTLKLGKTEFFIFPKLLQA
ncbi:MAG: histidine phosphatase family protein [Chitinophagales bacterium]|nr:histidine phosphatase family protein [Chitinophagales bacterium]